MRLLIFCFVCASLKIVEGRGVSGSEISTQVKRPQSHSEDAEQFTRELEHVLQTDPESAATIACFLCRQLMAASGQRVGLSQPQLQNSLHEKCHKLPEDLAAHCSNFVETFLQEIYFSLNYDFSAKNVCVALNICDKDMEITVESKADREKREKEEREKIEKEHKEREELEAEQKRIVAERERLERERRLKIERENKERRERMERLEKERIEKERLDRERRERDRVEQERLGRERAEKERIERERIEKIEKEKKEAEEKAKKRRKGIEEEMLSKDEKKLNCMFCDRMLDNAKSYAEMAKADIESFAATACAKWPRQRFADQCHRMAEEKVNRLNKFIDEQVVEALWCSELNLCDQ